MPRKGPQFGPAGMRAPGGPPGWKPPSVSDLLERMDKNKDGKLSKDEVPAPLWERLSKADANKDGAITKDELEAAHKKMQEQFREKMKEVGAARKKAAEQPSNPPK